MENVRLTQYSHGAGCGCKISPQVLDTILRTQIAPFADPNLLVGNESKDDAAVYDLGNGTAVISTTDFFMPIVDDPYDFGRIAATNAISDIYAMGGKPIMAIAILGWPVNVLAPLGIGVLTTAEKKSKLAEEHKGLARDWMCKLNKPGADFADVAGVKALTDVTGFGLLGHLSEICEGSGVKAKVWFDQVPHLPGVFDYIEQGCVPGGTERNFASYGDKIAPMTAEQKALLCDPQTSGGLLLAVAPGSEDEIAEIAKHHNIELQAIGELFEQDGSALIEVC